MVDDDVIMFLTKAIRELTLRVENLEHTLKLAVDAIAERAGK